MRLALNLFESWLTNGNQKQFKERFAFRALDPGLKAGACRAPGQDMAMALGKNVRKSE